MIKVRFFWLCVFFQAEDGIRDSSVTGVQDVCSSDLNGGGASMSRGERPITSLTVSVTSQIGRASCRERGEISVVAVSLKKKTKRTKSKSVMKQERHAFKLTMLIQDQL